MGDQTRELGKLAEEWAAELKGDTASLKEILADDFVAVGPRGFVRTGEQWIDRHEAGSLKYRSFALDEIGVRTYEDGRYDIDERFRATLVFVKQQESWRLAGLQLSPILGKP